MSKAACDYPIGTVAVFNADASPFNDNGVSGIAIVVRTNHVVDRYWQLLGEHSWHTYSSIFNAEIVDKERYGYAPPVEHFYVPQDNPNQG